MPDSSLSQNVCPECNGTGEVEEGCCCYQCEYDDSAHRRVVPCSECQQERIEREDLLRALADFGTSERLAALDTLRTLIERAERDALLLDGREHSAKRFAEAYRLLELLRVIEEKR